MANAAIAASERRSLAALPVALPQPSQALPRGNDIAGASVAVNDLGELGALVFT